MSLWKATRRIRTAWTLLLAFGTAEANATNYVVALLDDVGVDKLAVYHSGPEVPSTPTLDALARRGVVFRTAWATPTCSPTRAAALTGRRAERTGLGAGVPPGPGLSADEVSIADVLRGAGYATAAIGKWHLNHEPRHPLDLGFDTHRGARSNVGPRGYFDWRKFVDGEDQGRQTRYATSDTADDAIHWIEQQTGPWFLWLQFNAPHPPLHSPPAHLHTRGDLSKASASTVYAAMLEATDTELGRVVAAAGEDTTFLIMGDNGTYGRAISAPFDNQHGKRTVYEGGVRVPLIVSGPDVPRANRGQQSDALVQSSDLFATVTELAGFPASAEDSVSFASQLRDPSKPGRSAVYTSRFRPNGGPPSKTEYVRAARNERFKLIRGPGTNEELYDLSRDPHESQNLLARPLAADAADARARLSEVVDSLEWQGPGSGSRPDGRSEPEQTRQPGKRTDG